MDKLNEQELEILQEIRRLIRTLDSGTYEDNERAKKAIHYLGEQIYSFFDRRGEPVSFEKYMFLISLPDYARIAWTEDEFNLCHIVTDWRGITLRRKKSTARFYFSKIFYTKTEFNEPGKLNFNTTRYDLCHSRDESSAYEFHWQLVRRSKNRDSDGSMYFDGLKDYSIQEIYHNGEPIMQAFDEFANSGGFGGYDSKSGSTFKRIKKK